MQVINSNNESLILSKGDVTITKEVNNFAEMASYFSSRSVSLSLKNISHNRRLLGMVGVRSSYTAYPYRRNQWRVLDGANEIFGVANVIVLGFDDDTINIAVTADLNTFLELIKNETLGDLDVSSLNHYNTIPNIRLGASGQKDYHYIFGFNNGKLLDPVGGATNYDIANVTPSVKVEYLIDKLFDSVNWTYSFVGTNDYKEEFVSYPIGLESDPENAEGILIEEADNRVYRGNSERIELDMYNTFIDDSSIERLGFQGEYEALVTGRYTIQIAGLLERDNNYGRRGVLVLDLGGSYREVSFSSFDSETILNVTLNLSSGDLISLWVRLPDNYYHYDEFSVKDLSIKIGIVGVTAVEFSEALLDIELSKFLKEILVRYAVVPYVDAVNKHIDFITQEYRLKKPSEGSGILEGAVEVVSKYVSYNRSYTTVTQKKIFLTMWRTFIDNSKMEQLGSGRLKVLYSGNYIIKLSGILNRISPHNKPGRLVLDVDGVIYSELFYSNNDTTTIDIELNLEQGEIITFYVEDGVVSGSFFAGTVRVEDLTEEISIKYADTITPINISQVEIDSRDVLSISHIYQADMAQENWLRHQYSEDNQTYADGAISVYNENLERSKTIYDSFVYAPEEKESIVLKGPGNSLSNTLLVLNTKVYDREVKEEDNEIKIEYKSLDGRFYFIKANQTQNKGVYVSGNEIENVRIVDATNTYNSLVENYNALDSVLSNYEEVTIKLNKRAYHSVNNAKRVVVETLGIIAVTSVKLSSGMAEIKGLIIK